MTTYFKVRFALIQTIHGEDILRSSDGGSGPQTASDKEDPYTPYLLDFLHGAQFRLRDREIYFSPEAHEYFFQKTNFYQ